MLLSCANVSVVYGQEDGSQAVALRRITLSVRGGERVAIVGPNGSGKSTLALVIAGLLGPSSGQVTCDGIPVTTPTGAVVFQAPDDNLLGGTVTEEIRLSLDHIASGSELEHLTSETLARFGLEALADRAASRLSGGEKQITALACSFASRRPLIVLDEPTSHLDPIGKRSLWRALDLAVANSESTPAIIMVTQYPDEVGHFDRLIALDDGAIVYDGPPAGWRNPKVTPRPCIQIPEPVEGTQVVSVRNLRQVDMPGWTLPTNPLRGVSLDIRRGEAIALCGPIGAGKTTLALLLAGLLAKYAGERRLDAGTAVMLIQFPERQMFRKTVEDEVAYGLIARGVPKDEAIERSRAALRQVGLSPDEFARRSPFSLSGGQKRRVMLAAATVLDASLYILDEPQAALDDDGQAALASMCQHWLGQKSSYVLISHDQAFLRSLTSRVLVLDQGALRFDGTWDDRGRLPNLLSGIGFTEN